MKTKFQEMEEMISSFPPTLELLKTALISKLKEVEQEYVPSWRSISWTVQDFEWQAQNLVNSDLTLNFDDSKFEDTLERMIKEHDATIGISWETLSVYLMTYCKI